MRFNETVGGRQKAVGGGGARGFTLVELMIVVVILALLASIAVYSYSRILDRSKQKKAMIDMNTFVGALDAYYGEKGHYPDNSEGLKALVPEFIKSIPNDPWGHPYQYVQPGRTAPFDIISYGADGREGGSGADMDISSNDKDVAQKK